MANRSRKRKPVQAGVEAIFTTEKNWRGKAAAALGVLGLGTGTVFWVWLIIQGSSSLTLVSLSMLLVISGVALCMYSLAIRKTREETDRLRSALYELEVLVEPKTGPGESILGGQPSGESRIGNGLPHHKSKTLGVLVAQTIVLIIFYAGMVHEYVSNPNMQQWVQSNIWPASFILNYNALFLVVGGLMGTAIFQLLGKRYN